MKILLLTPIPLEQEAVRRHLTSPTEQIVEGDRYVTGRFAGQFQQFEIISLRTGSGNSVVALATERAVRRFRPVAVLLVGVAGGVKDVEIGDVVIGTKYYDYEFAHEGDAGSSARPNSGKYDKSLRALAESVSERQNWWSRLPSDQIPRVIFGPIAGGNKVLAATSSEVFRFLKNNYNDTTAVEMEAAGFGEAMHHYPHTPALNIRGISDLIDGKKQADAAGSQVLAAGNAAAFAFALIDRIDPAYFTPQGMEVRTRLDDFAALIQQAQAAKNPGREDEEYPPPPNRAPRELERLQPLSPEDRQYIFDLLEANGKEAQNKKIRAKLESLYDFQQLGLEALRRPAIERFEALETAKENKRQVILKQYRSNSNQVRDRRVEPFKIDANLDTLQAYDVDSQDNRHFRLSRMQRVVPTETPWQHEQQHVRKETDDFRIADNEMVNVQLELDVLARNLLTETYPNTRRNLLPGTEPNTWYYEASVNHRFFGLINFIMGNANHVEVVGPEQLKQRMREEAEKVLKKIGPS